MLDSAYCPVCHDERPVELLPCSDGHGEDCAERVCVACSTAIFAGVLPGPAARGASPGRGVHAA